MITLELVKTLTTEDEKILLKSVSLDPWKVSIKDIQDRSDINEFLIYRVVGPETSGIIVVSVFERGDSKTLFIQHLAGKGMIRYGDEILFLLEGLAKALECKSLTGSTIPKGLVRFYEKLGFYVESINVAKEIEDGR